MGKCLVVGVRFKKAGKVYYFDPQTIDLEIGDAAIVKTARGLEYGEVVTGPKYVTEKEIVAPLKQVIRKAGPKDEEKYQQIQAEEEEAFNICLDKIDKHGLDMKLVDVEKSFDDSKIIFYFTAEGRVDFRELVKDLAGVFKTRIELRQIGVRDEAKMLGGIGPCGRELCCASFLGDFEPVSIKMAKDQDLALNPGKISGVCGRLMCCLRYESDIYEKAQEVFPSPGSIVKIEEEEAEVTDFNVVKETVQVKMNDTHQIKEVPLEDIDKESLAQARLENQSQSQQEGQEGNECGENECYGNTPHPRCQNRWDKMD